MCCLHVKDCSLLSVQPLGGLIAGVCTAAGQSHDLKHCLYYTDNAE